MFLALLCGTPTVDLVGLPGGRCAAVCHGVPRQPGRHSKPASQPASHSLPATAGSPRTQEPQEPSLRSLRSPAKIKAKVKAKVKRKQKRKKSESESESEAKVKAKVKRK